MEILNLIEAKEKAKKIVESCTTEKQLKAAEKYVELFKNKFEDNLSYHKLKKEISEKYRKLDNMEVLRDFLYAGLGLAEQTEDKFIQRYQILVQKGKKVDEEGKNVINDFFKTLEEAKEQMGETYNKKLQNLEEFISKLKV